MYNSPSAMEMALKSRARGVAKPMGISTEDLLRRFHFQRLLARVFTEDGWLLKGGQALLVRYGGQARYSRDIDLFRPGVDDLTEAVEALRRAARLDLGDFFTFTEAGPVSHADETGGAKLKFAVLIGTRKVGTVNVDIVVRRQPTGEPTITDIVPAVPIDWPDNWPQVHLYPLSDHLADKICAIYEWHANGTAASTRCRDLADILLIAQQERVNGTTVQTALSSERLRRTSIGTDLRLPGHFEIPDPTFWSTNYPSAAKEVTGLIGCRTLAEAATAADIFVTPILSASDPGLWQPTDGRWERTTEC